LIQTRVPRGLESTLKEAAQKQRLSVSHLIRNVLEDTFVLVDNVVAEVDNLVSDSVGLANRVRKDARQIARAARGETDSRRAERRGGGQQTIDTRTPKAETAARDDGDPLRHVYAWNEVVLNRAARCAHCKRTLAKGDIAHLGLSQDPSAGPSWLCDDCLGRL
jgi:hypothetical protein